MLELILLIFFLFAWKFIFGKIKCWFMSRHEWGSGGIVRYCQSCGKRQVLNMRLGEYVDYR